MKMAHFGFKHGSRCRTAVAVAIEREDGGDLKKGMASKVKK